MSPALVGGLSTTGPAGKSRHLTFYALPFDTTISHPLNNTLVSLALQELFIYFFIFQARFFVVVVVVLPLYFLIEE